MEIRKKRTIKLFFILIFLCTIMNAHDGKTSSNNNEKMKPALIIIDIQNEYLPQMDEAEKKFVLHAINGAIWFFRQNNLPIIRIYHSDLRWGPEEGTEPFEYPKSVIINDKDTKVRKHYPSAFTKTELDKILNEKGCNTLFLCGLSATACVLATYFGGMDLGYKTFIIKEGIMSHKRDYTNIIKDICESVNFETMMFFIQNNI